MRSSFLIVAVSLAAWGCTDSEGDGAIACPGTAIDQVAEEKLIPSGSCDWPSTCVMYTSHACPTPGSGGVPLKHTCSCVHGNWSCEATGITTATCGS